MHHTNFPFTNSHNLPEPRRGNIAELSVSWPDEESNSSICFTNFSSRHSTASLLTKSFHILEERTRKVDCSYSYLSIEVPQRYTDLPSRITIATPYHDQPNKIDLSTDEDKRFGALYDAALLVLGEMQKASLLPSNESGELEITMLPFEKAEFFPFKSAALNMLRRLDPSNGDELVYSPISVSLWNPDNLEWMPLLTLPQAPKLTDLLYALHDTVDEKANSHLPEDLQLCDSALEKLKEWDKYRGFESNTERYLAAKIYSFSHRPALLQRALALLNTVLQIDSSHEKASNLFSSVAGRLREQSGLK